MEKALGEGVVSNTLLSVTPAFEISEQVSLGVMGLAFLQGRMNQPAAKPGPVSMLTQKKFANFTHSLEFLVFIKQGM